MFTYHTLYITRICILQKFLTFIMLSKIDEVSNILFYASILMQELKSWLLLMLGSAPGKSLAQ
jgi:hypothetical protein